MLNESEHDKTNEITYAPSEDVDKPGDLPRLINPHCPPIDGLGIQLPMKRTAKFRWTHKSFCLMFWPQLYQINTHDICNVKSSG